MSARDDGGPAFPVTGLSVESGPDDTEVWGSVDCKGMTLRDYFAGQALQGAIADVSQSNLPDDVAAYAYELADAMLKARREKPCE